MASSIVVTIKGDIADPARLAADSSCDQVGVVGLCNYLEACAMGAENASIDFQYTTGTAPVAASGTVTCASVAADDTVTIGSVTLTAKASPSGENQFDQSGTDTADGVSLAAKINAHSTLSKIVSASAASGVVTITCLVKGMVGNHLVLDSSNGTRLAVTEFTGGTGGAQTAAKTWRCGL
jgi:phage tail sheath gpL-like